MSGSDIKEQADADDRNTPFSAADVLGDIASAREKKATEEAEKAKQAEKERDELHQAFLEREIVHSGIRLIKYYFDVSQSEQERRFKARINDPMRQWKLSPMDLESYRRWWEYSKAIDEMFITTDTEYAPWYVVHADDKRRARLNCISHLLSMIPYEEVPFEKPTLPRRRARPKGLSETRMYERFVPGRY